MIKTEYLNDGTLIRHYSDSGYVLLQVETGEKYADPIDVVPCPYTYEETDELAFTDEDNDGDNEGLPTEGEFPGEEEASAEDALAELVEVLQ